MLEPINFSLGQDFSVKPETGFTIESVAQAISILESSLRSVVKQLGSLNSSTQDFRDFVEPSLIWGEQSILDLNTSIGSRPSFLPPQFDSPTLWTTLGHMSSELLNVSNQASFNFTKRETDTKNIASEAAKHSFSTGQDEWMSPLLQWPERFEMSLKPILLLLLLSHNLEITSRPNSSLRTTALCTFVA